MSLSLGLSSPMWAMHPLGSEAGILGFERNYGNIYICLSYNFHLRFLRMTMLINKFLYFSKYELYLPPSHIFLTCLVSGATWLSLWGHSQWWCLRVLEGAISFYNLKKKQGIFSLPDTKIFLNGAVTQKPNTAARWGTRHTLPCWSFDWEESPH